VRPRPLEGVGVLVTRPQHQADELVAAIEAAGGIAYRFPVFDVVPREVRDVAREIERLGPSDIVIFVSANAVRYGLSIVGDPQPRVAAIGPATAAALERAGVAVDIRPSAGFTSEHLLAEPSFNEISGQAITIVRGERGRELLAETLRCRGADVRYLSVYATRPHVFTDTETGTIARALRERRISAVVVMSVATFDHLERALPPDCLDALAGTRLVAPGGRVIQTLAERLPGATCIESPGPGAEALTDALIASLQEGA
jgi:uroporphyrinogen-III synthase